MADSLQLSIEEAQNFLATYHLGPMTMESVFGRLGTVQYDPLNPCGRNIDLVLQARVPGYQVDDWQNFAYEQRKAYDAWDKQACLVPIGDWPMRAITRERYRPWHDREVLEEHPEAVTATLQQIDARGPMSSLEFEDRMRIGAAHSWMGQTRVKRILRALWACGDLVTHHREGGRHYFDRPQRVIPSEYLEENLRDIDLYHRWIVLRRHRAAGLLRPRAGAEIWSACGDSVTRLRAIEELTENAELLPVYVGEKRLLFHMPADASCLLNTPPPPPRMVFLGPLDSLLWDRQAIRQLFGFTYLWEVYKKPADRIWGYYVLPVFYGGRFVGRIDCRLIGDTLAVSHWWWEDGAAVDADGLDQLKSAFARFLEYMGAEKATAERQVPREVRQALSQAVRERRVTFRADGQRSTGRKKA